MSEAQPGQHSEKPDLKRYPLVIPRTLWDQVVERADASHTSILSILRKYIEAGLVVDQALEKGAVLVKKEGDKETELLII